MERVITLEGNKITYTIRKSTRAHRMRMTVYPDKKIVVTLPSHLDQNVAERFIGEKYHWLIKKLDFFEHNNIQPILRHNRREYLAYKNNAYRFVTERIQDINKMYGFKFGRISIRNSKSRWGSCSRSGNLNFNYRIVLLPSNMADYIIVHEICHIGEFNHSKKFWDLVAKTVPDFAIIRKKLRSGGNNLFSLNPCITPTS